MPNSKDKDPLQNLNWQESFSVAMKGFAFAFVQEASVRRAVIAAVILIGITLVIGAGFIESLVVIIIWTQVVIFELFNTSVEKVLDYTCEYKFHPLVKYSKDTLAAAVFVCSLVGSLVFIAVLGRHFLGNL